MIWHDMLQSNPLDGRARGRTANGVERKCLALS